MEESLRDYPEMKPPHPDKHHVPSSLSRSSDVSAGDNVAARRRKIDFIMPFTVFTGLLGIFLLPWFVPRDLPVCSASYTLGFNNMAASSALAALLATLFIQLKRKKEGDTTKALRDILLDPGPRLNSRRSVIVYLSVMTLTVAVLIAWYQMMPYSFFGEFGSDVSRLDQMVLGLRPYRDFQYNYGPAMLYPAYWIYLIFGNRLSIDAAFCATLLIQWVLGLSLLFYTVTTLCRGRHVTMFFLISFLAIFNLTMGAGYTPLRFMAPIASLLFLHSVFNRWSIHGTNGLVRCATLSIILSLASLSLSPEIGISTIAGISAFFSTMYFTTLRRFSFVAFAPLTSLGLAVLVLSPSYADGVFSVGAGANNFPVFPTLPILLHTAASCLILPRLGLLGIRERHQGGALAVGLAVGLALLLPAAFGRCDSAHVLFNGLGILLLFLAVAYRIPNRITSTFMIGAFVFVYPVATDSMIIYGNHGRYKELRDARSYRQALAALLFNEEQNTGLWYSYFNSPIRIRYGKLPPLSDLPQLLRYQSLGTPFYPGDEIDRFLKLSGRYVPEYYSGINIQVYTPSEVIRKLRDLQTMHTILVSKDHVNYPIFIYEADPNALSKLMQFPSRLIPKPRRKPYFPGYEIMRYIRQNFTVIDEFSNFEIWQRNN